MPVSPNTSNPYLVQPSACVIRLNNFTQLRLVGRPTGLVLPTTRRMNTTLRSAGGCPCRPAPGQVVPLPFYEPGGCGAPSFLETTAAKPMETLLLYGSYATVWAFLWLACGLLVVPVVSRMPPSSKAHENNIMYAGQKVAASLKAWAVGSIANLALTGISGD